MHYQWSRNVKGFQNKHFNFIYIIISTLFKTPNFKNGYQDVKHERTLINNVVFGTEKKANLSIHTEKDKITQNNLWTKIIQSSNFIAYVHTKILFGFDTYPVNVLF